MTARFLIVWTLFWGGAATAHAQLQLRLPISFASFEQGSSFSTSTSPTANSDYCDTTGDEPAAGSVQCGEVDTQTSFAFRVGGSYRASVSATALVMGTTRITWSPSVACVRVDDNGESISGGSGSSCTQSVTARDQGIFWDLGGSVSIPGTAPAGSYASDVTLAVSGPGLNDSITLDATLTVTEASLQCNVSTAGSLDFGRAAARQEGTISISPVTGSRSYAGGQHDPSGTSSFSLATAEVSTDAQTVVASVAAPATLGGVLSYDSYLASRRLPSGSWSLAISGSGSASRTVGATGRLGYRLGGRVRTTSTSAANSFAAAVSLSFSCN